MRRVKSEENVADLGTKPLSKAVIAKHCLSPGCVNMAEENVQCEHQLVADVLGLRFSSQLAAAVSRRPGPASQQQQKQPVATEATTASGPGDQRSVCKRPREVLGRLFRISKSFFLHCFRLRHRAQIDFGKFRQGEYLRFHQTETSSLSAPNVSVARKCCSSRVSLAKKPAESTTLLSRSS